MLRCPIDGTTLAIADSELVNQLNESIAQENLRDRQDQKITEPIDAALVTNDKKRVYPTRGGSPTLIAGESIAIG